MQLIRVIASTQNATFINAYGRSRRLDLDVSNKFVRRVKTVVQGEANEYIIIEMGSKLMEIEKAKTEKSEVKSSDNSQAAISAHEVFSPGQESLTGSSAERRSQSGGGEMHLPGLNLGDLDQRIDDRNRITDILISPHIQRGFTDLEMRGISNEIAEQLIKDRTLGARFDDVISELKKAANADQFEDMVKMINEKLVEKGSNISLTYSSEHQQDKMLPELSSFTSWTHYTVRLNENNREIDSRSFDGAERHHGGIMYRNRILPNMEIK